MDVQLQNKKDWVENSRHKSSSLITSQPNIAQASDFNVNNFASNKYNIIASITSLRSLDPHQLLQHFSWVISELLKMLLPIHKMVAHRDLLSYTYRSKIRYVREIRNVGYPIKFQELVAWWNQKIYNSEFSQSHRHQTKGVVHMLSYTFFPWWNCNFEVNH